MLSNYKKSVHFVLDIETLGTRPGCPILQIGAVRVESGVATRQNEFFASIGSNMRNGLNTLEMATLQWWQARHPQQFQKILDNSENHEIMDALDDFIEFCSPLWRGECQFFWAKHPSFDFPILDAAFEKFDRPTPWRFWQIRDIATLEDEMFVKTEPVKNDHDALNDAINEANVLIEAVWGDDHDR